MSEDKRNFWIEKITDGFHVIANKYDLPEDMRHEIEGYVLNVAKDQYFAGNKSGIAWLRKQAGAKQGQILAAIDAPQAVGV
jgi:hypothetical protein